MPLAGYPLLQPRAPFFFSSTNKFIFILTTHLEKQTSKQTKNQNEDPQG